MGFKSRAEKAENELKHLQLEMEQNERSKSKDADDKYTQLKMQYDQLENAHKINLKEINEQNEKHTQDLLSIERINQGKILMQKEAEYNELLQSQLQEQQKMHEQRLADELENFEKRIVLLKQEADHKLEMYKLDMEERLENEKSMRSQSNAAFSSAKEEEIRSAVRQEMSKEYNQQRDELVKMMKSQAEEYRDKIKKRHADQIIELENEIVSLKAQLENSSNALLTKKNELESSFQIQSEEKQKLKEEIALLKNELAERDNTEAMYREEFEKELEKDMMALTAAATQNDGGTKANAGLMTTASDQEFARQFEKQWHNELTQSFADDAMKEVDEIVGDALLEDENGNYLSMVLSEKKYDLSASAALHFGESDGIVLPGVTSSHKASVPSKVNDNTDRNKKVDGKIVDGTTRTSTEFNNDEGRMREVDHADSSAAPLFSNVSQINDDAKGKLNIENLSDEFTTEEKQNKTQASVKNNDDEPLSDIKLQEEKYGNDNNNGAKQILLEEEEEFGIQNVGPYEGGNNSILPGETAEEYVKRKVEKE